MKTNLTDQQLKSLQGYGYEGNNTLYDLVEFIDIYHLNDLSRVSSHAGKGDWFRDVFEVSEYRDTYDFDMIDDGTEPIDGLYEYALIILRSIDSGELQDVLGKRNEEARP